MAHDDVIERCIRWTHTGGSVLSSGQVCCGHMAAQMAAKQEDVGTSVVADQKDELRDSVVAQGPECSLTFHGDEETGFDVGAQRAGWQSVCLAE